MKRGWRIAAVVFAIVASCWLRGEAACRVPRR
jgi:hypothetical protein